MLENCDQQDGCTGSESCDQQDGCTVSENRDQQDGCTLSENESTCTVQKSEIGLAVSNSYCTMSEANVNVIGSVSIVKNNDDEAMLQDVKYSFDVKPKQKLKPSRLSKRLKQKKAKQCQERAHLNLSTSSGTRKTRNSQKMSKEVAAANLVSKSKNYVFSYKKYGLKKPDLKKKPHHCPACK